MAATGRSVRMFHQTACVAKCRNERGLHTTSVNLLAEDSRRSGSQPHPSIASMRQKYARPAPATAAKSGEDAAGLVALLQMLKVKGNTPPASTGAQATTQPQTNSNSLLGDAVQPRAALVESEPSASAGASHPHDGETLPRQDSVQAQPKAAPLAKTLDLLTAFSRKSPGVVADGTAQGAAEQEKLASPFETADTEKTRQSVEKMASALTSTRPQAPDDQKKARNVENAEPLGVLPDFSTIGRDFGSSLDEARRKAQDFRAIVAGFDIAAARMREYNEPCVDSDLQNFGARREEMKGNWTEHMQLEAHADGLAPTDWRYTMMQGVAVTLGQNAYFSVAEKTYMLEALRTRLDRLARSEEPIAEASVPVTKGKAPATASQAGDAAGTQVAKETVAEEPVAAEAPRRVLADDDDEEYEYEDDEEDVQRK